MADYQMAGYYEGETQDEYERRKRREAEEQAQAQAQDQENGISQQPAAGGLDLAGVANRYVQNRLGQAQQRVTDAGQMFTDPEAALNRRLGMPTTQDAANTEVQSQQVKTYADGSKEEIVKRQMPAPAPAPEPAPVAPTPMPPAPQVATAPAAQAQTQQAPVQPPRPVSPEQQAQQEAMVRAVQQPQNVPAVGPSVQVASTDRGAGVAEAAQAAQPVAPTPTTPTGQTPVGAPAPAPSLAQAGAQAAATPRPQWAIDLEAAGTDQDKLVDIAANKTYPRDVREDAKAKLRQAQDNAIAESKAQKLVQGMAQGDPKAQNTVLQAMKASSIKRDEGKVTEGSYIRAYLYARLGLNDLAKEEQEKIMGRTEYGQVSLGKEKYEITTDKRTGQITSARDSQGTPVETPILNRIRAESLKVSTAQLPSSGATRIRDSEGTEFSVVPTPQGSTFYNNKGEQAVPVGRTVPIAVGSDLEIAQAKEDIQTVAKFSQQTAAARLKAFENTNAKRADRLLPLLSLDEMGLRSDGSLASEDVRRPGTGTAVAPTAAPAAVAPTPVASATVAQKPAATAVAPTPVAASTATSTPLVSTAGPVAGGGGGGRTPAGSIPTAESMDRQSKESDLERSARLAQIKDRDKSNQDYADELAKSRASATAQNSTINRIQSSIDRNPEFFGIDTNSKVWRAYVDLNSTNADKAESLNTLARNLNIPKEKRAQFDSTMNDYRNLQVSAITSSGLTASQTNTERESQRVLGTVGSLADRPESAKATLEYAKAKIEYTDKKARAFANERRVNPGMDRLAFESNFDAREGEKIFADANERMAKILAPVATTPGSTSSSGTTSSGNRFKRVP